MSVLGLNFPCIITVSPEPDGNNLKNVEDDKTLSKSVSGLKSDLKKKIGSNKKEDKKKVREQSLIDKLEQLLEKLEMDQKFPEIADEGTEESEMEGE